MKNKQNLMLIAFSALFVTAVALTVTSASLPAISRDLHRPVADFGPLFFSFFLGFTTAVSLAGIISDRVGRRILAVGLGLISGGLLLFGWAGSLSLMYIASLLCGAGCGITEGSSSALIADLNPRNQGVWLNLSQVFFAVGAIAAPVAVGMLYAQTGNWRLAYIVSGLIAAVCFLLGIIQRYPKPAQGEARLEFASVRKLFTSKQFALVCLAMAFYVASEQGVASWLPSYFELVLKAPALVSSASLSAFWAAMVFGRLAGSYALNFMEEKSLVTYWSLGGLLVLGFSLGLRSYGLTLVGVFLAGLMYAPIWPTVLSFGVNELTSLKGTATGILIAAGSIGGMVYPTLVGVLAKYTGLHTALAFSLAPVLGVFLIFRAVQSRSGRIDEAC